MVSVGFRSFLVLVSTGKYICNCAVCFLVSVNHVKSKSEAASEEILFDKICEVLKPDYHILLANSQRSK